MSKRGVLFGAAPNLASAAVWNAAAGQSPEDNFLAG